MRVLLDTCTFLWAGLDEPRLSASAREILANPENACYLSVVSVWEIALKHGLGALPLPEPPRTFVPKLRKDLQVESLEIDEDAALHLAQLPSVHRDPFDRMLICQAIVHGLALMTPDEMILRYPARVIW